MRQFILLAALATGLASLAIAVASPDVVSTRIRNAVADRSRSASHIASDANRKPAETLAFAGVTEGMLVGELFPGGGYYTQLLSAVVGPNGHVYGIENEGWTGAVKSDNDFLVKQHLMNVSIVGFPFGKVSFPKPLDLVWITQNYHDLKVEEFGQVDTTAFNRLVFDSLKPGGTYFVLDHEAPTGTDVQMIAKLHRIEKAQVIKEVTAVGFTLAAEGTFLCHPDDDRSLPIFEKRVQGRTDQYALKFVKPN